jgi:serine/threonine-protein kinase RsbW
MMESRLSLVLRNDLSELERMSEAVSAWCRGNAISATAEYQVNLALDEIVSNVIRHGWKDDGEHQLHVRISRLEDELRVEVEDDATPFNPLEAPAPDVNLPLEERPVGGLGIHLVRQFMDGLEYRRQGARNCLVMKKKTTAV